MISQHFVSQTESKVLLLCVVPLTYQSPNTQVRGAASCYHCLIHVATSVNLLHVISFHLLTHPYFVL